METSGSLSLFPRVQLLSPLPPPRSPLSAVVLSLFFFFPHNFKSKNRSCSSPLPSPLLPLFDLRSGQLPFSSTLWFITRGKIPVDLWIKVAAAKFTLIFQTQPQQQARSREDGAPPLFFFFLTQSSVCFCRQLPLSTSEVKSLANKCAEQILEIKSLKVLNTHPSYHIRLVIGSIGWSVGATLGYALAATDKRVITCISDGSFQQWCSICDAPKVGDLLDTVGGGQGSTGNKATETKLEAFAL